MTTIGIPDSLEVIGEKQIAVSSSEVALVDNSIPNTATQCLITVSSDGAVFASFVTGSTTVSDGKLYRAYEQFRITTRNDMAQAKFIRSTVDLTLYVQFFGEG